MPQALPHRAPAVTRSARRRVPGALIAVVVVSAIGALPAGSQALKVRPSPSAPTLTEGQSALVTFTLDEPIIAPGPDPGYVTLDLTAGDPARVQLSVGSVTWAFDEWFQQRQVTVTAVADGVHNTDDTVVVTGLVRSNSEYYDAYVATITVTIVDTDPEPTTTVPATTTTSQAPPDDDAAPVAAARPAALAFTG